MFYLNFSSTSPDRYSLSKFLNFDTTNNVHDINTSYLVQNIKSLDQAGTFLITHAYDKQPQIVSRTLYDNQHLWSLLLMYNDIISVDDFVEGLTISYFSLDALEKFYFTLRSKSLS